MRGRFFLDTNLFIYSFDQSARAKATRAMQLIRQALTSGQGVVSYQVVQEFFSVALRRFARPMDMEEAQQYLVSVFRPLLSVHSSQALYGEALRLAGRYQLSWYDALIVAGAIEGRCSVLYSEDLQHGMQFGDLRVENPFR
jgi:predicted nucleic acid-binding protein